MKNPKNKTVAEFIEELKKVPQNLPIIIKEPNYYGDPDFLDYVPTIYVDCLETCVQILKD